MEYNFREIEKKWHQKWVENKTYKVTEDENKKKFYVLNMFPYPSGAGLHVGHPLGYIASDIYARYKRLNGYNVLNPMGYDAYGLPAEQYAIQTGQHPEVTTVANINRYREQLDKIGFSFDWDREVRTCDPKYYHWTQWAFQKMFNSFFCNGCQKAQPIEKLIKRFEEKGIMEGMLWHFKMPKAEAYQKALKLLEEVGITDAEKRMKSYPHQLSGGMRQRVVIAIALSCDPDLLICDEPTTALDVTIQAKILELIRSIQKERGISVIYITHDLGVVAKVADYVDVMYAGKIVETGTIDEIFYDPRHPYTWGLLSAMPDLDTADERLYTIPGSPPNLLHEKAGDAFAPRNKYALEIDDEIDPPMFKISDTHFAATWLLDPRAPKVEMPPELKDRVARMSAEAKKIEEAE